MALKDSAKQTEQEKEEKQHRSRSTDLIKSCANQPSVDH